MGQQRKHLEFSALFLVAYTSLIVGVAEGYLFPYALTPLVILLSVLLSRYWEFLRLNTLTANVLGFLAFFLAAAELFSGNIEARLLAGAHLMAYLTWIVVLQRRQLSHYWWMVALCVLQTAIGSILMNAALYGIFLLVFLLLSMWTLALFSLHRSQTRFLQWSEARDADLAAATVGRHAGNGQENSPSAKPAASKSLFSRAFLAPSSATGSMQIDESDRWLTTRFVAGILGLSLASAVVAFVFFGLIPRQWLGSRTWGFSDTSLAGQQLVGFSEEVSLDSYGSMLESTERVLEVRVIDAVGNRVPVFEYATQLGYDEPLFRGYVLDRYEAGSWSRHETDLMEFPVRPVIPPEAVRQEYRIRPIGTRTLFAMRPMPLGQIYTFHTGQRRRALTIEPVGSVIQRNKQAMSSKEFVYQIFTSKQVPESGNPSSPSWCLSISDPELLKALQEFLRTEVQIRADAPPRQQAQQIVRFLRDSNKYSYTLNIPPRRSRDKDPVLEFLQDRRTGHCQYFATALALLLRANGIPSRIVGGFKGGEENNLTGYFDVQQRHAHAWVEAFIENRWTTLDATPAARAEAVAQTGSWFESWKTFLTDFWSHYVVELDYNDQKKLVFDPLKATADDAWNAASLKQTASSNRWQALKEFLSNPSRWFSWQGGVFSFVIMLLVAGVVWVGKRAAKLLRRIREQINLVQRPDRRVEFYERFARLCTALGLVRRASQTQREFAETVGETLATKLPQLTEADLPAQITTVFYQVRFGDQELTPEQGREIDGKLAMLEKSLHPAK